MLQRVKEQVDGGKSGGYWACAAHSEKFLDDYSVPKTPLATFVLQLVCEWQFGDIAHLVN